MVDELSIDSIKQVKPISASPQGLPVQPGNSFQSYMRSPNGGAINPTNSVGMVTPFDLPSQASRMQLPTYDSLGHQLRSSGSIFDSMQQGLGTKGLTLQAGQQKILAAKLGNVHRSLNKANALMGGSQIPLPSSEGPEPVVAKYINFVVGGQQLLDSMKQKLADLSKQGGEISPAKLLMIQTQLAYAQQSLEYGSILLSQAVGAVKTLFQVQM